MSRHIAYRAAVMALATAGVIALLLAGAAPRASAQRGFATPAYAPNEILVQFRPGATAAMRQDALRRVNAARQEVLAADASGPEAGPGLLRLAVPMAVPQAVQALAGHPAVAFAEPNWVVRHQEISNDPYYTKGMLWGMCGSSTLPINPYGSQAAAAWANRHVGSAEVFVGVIDEGIDYSHPDLTPNIWINPYDPPNGRDDDGNGYVDDVRGWDFYNRDNTIYDYGYDTHGTHVCGTIGAVGGNGYGVAGVCWKVTVISGKFLGPYGGYTSDAVKAVDYFVDLKQRHGLRIVALNNSWGGDGYSQAMHDAILRAAKADILFVAAAGNGYNDNDRYPYYPTCYSTTVGTSTEPAAWYESVISVAAIDRYGKKPGWSNYGAKTVDLGAPGDMVMSTLAGSAHNCGYMSGTSMATPHVTGAAALYASIHPAATAMQIRNAILDAARATPTVSLKGRTTTGGRLHVGRF